MSDLVLEPGISLKINEGSYDIATQPLPMIMNVSVTLGFPGFQAPEDLFELELNADLGA